MFLMLNGLGVPMTVNTEITIFDVPMLFPG